MIIPYGSVFSGIEMASVALEQVGGFEPVFFAEINRDARAVLRHRFPQMHSEGRILGDMRKIDCGVPGPDGRFMPAPGYNWAVGALVGGLLIGGSPCQSFSSEGSGGGELDPRGQLFWEFIRLAARLAPTWLVLENVEGLIKADGGDLLRRAERTLHAMGYSTALRLINSRYHGVAQDRRRVFLVGSRCATAPAESVLMKLVPGDDHERFEGGRTRPQGLANKRWQLDRDHAVWEVDPAPDDAASVNMARGGSLRLGSVPTIMAKDRDNRAVDRRRGGPLRTLSASERLSLFGMPPDWCKVPVRVGGKWIDMPEQRQWPLAGNGFVVGVIKAIAAGIKAAELSARMYRKREGVEETAGLGPQTPGDAAITGKDPERLQGRQRRRRLDSHLDPVE